MRIDSVLNRAIAASAILLVSSLCNADELILEIKSPDVRIVVPNVPTMKMEPHPMREGRPHLRLLGTEGPYTVSVMTPTADAGITPIECASSAFGDLPRRPGVPPASQIVKAKINDRTFLALYNSVLAGATHLHAHLVSGVGGKYCVEVHVSKFPASEDDVKSWNKGWGKATFDPQ